MIRLAIVLLIGFAGISPDTPKPQDRSKTENSNAILKEHAAKLAVSASSEWSGWEAAKLVDGNIEKSWFSAKNDSVGVQKDKDNRPWVKIELPRDENVSLVTILGNREKPWEKDYSVLSGRLELIDADGKILMTKDDEGKGEHKDFDWILEKPVHFVRSIRFVILGDEGDKNPCGDVALAEIRIE